MDTITVIEKIIEQGGLFAILVLGMFMASRMAWWLAKRLFAPTESDSPGGLVTEWFTDQKVFMDGLAKRVEAQTAESVHHGATLLDIKKGVDGVARFDKSMVDLARAANQLLVLNSIGQIPAEKAAEIKAELEQLMKAVEDRHVVA